MPSPKPPRRAFLTLELVVAVAITVIVATLLTVAVVQYVAARREHDTRRLLRAVAETELARMRAGVLSVAPSVQELATSRPAAVHVTTSTVPGVGLWHGLTRVHIVASTSVSNREIKVELGGYVAAEEGVP